MGMVRRKLLKTSKINSTEYDVKKMFAATKTSSAHCVIQLSRRQANRLSPNSIHITNSQRIDKSLLYQDIKVML